jgi:hypothetical protein
MNVQLQRYNKTLLPSPPELHIPTIQYIDNTINYKKIPGAVSRKRQVNYKRLNIIFIRQNIDVSGQLFVRN